MTPSEFHQAFAALIAMDIAAVVWAVAIALVACIEP